MPESPCRHDSSDPRRFIDRNLVEISGEIGGEVKVRLKALVFPHLLPLFHQPFPQH